MEQNRENGTVGGHPGSGSAPDPGMFSPEKGFEGMNYEQRREPYQHKRTQQANHAPSQDNGGNLDYYQRDEHNRK